MSITKRNCYYSIGASFSLLIGIFLVLLFADSSFATSASTTTASVKVASACTLTTTGEGNYSATVPNGTSAEISGSTLTVSCNDAGGFALYAVGYSNDTVGNNNMIGSNVNIATNTSGNDSYWAMKVNPVTGNTPTIDNSFSSYHVIPTTHTKVASYSQSAPGGLSVKATYKVNISATQSFGNYLGQVKYTLIHPSNGNSPVEPLADTDCPTNSICYAPNANDIEGSMDSISSTKITGSPLAGVQTSVSSSGTTVLIAPNYSRTGYGFAGWSTEYNAANANNAIIYGPNETITTATDGTGDADVSSNGLILYPVWVASKGDLQTWNGCNSLTQASPNTRATINSITALRDQRDDDVYAVAKLADGKCWMIENLRLDAYDSIDSSLAQGYGTSATYGNFVGLANAENTDFSNVQVTQSSFYNSKYYSGEQGGTAFIDIGSTNDPASRIPRYNNNNTNRALTARYNAEGGSYYWYGYGNYYNWPAAIADTAYYNTNNQLIGNTSICPNRWRLPIGGDKNNEQNNEYWNLVVTLLNNGTGPGNYDSSVYPYYTGSTEAVLSRPIRDFPNNYIMSGYVEYGYPNNKHKKGYYWTSNVNTNLKSYTLAFSGEGGYLYPGTGWEPKTTGYSIRCLLNN